VEALFLVLFSGLVAAPFLGKHVHDYGTVESGSLAEGSFHVGNIVAVQGAHVAHPERLEERRWLDHFANSGVKALQTGISKAAHLREISQSAFHSPPSRANVRVKAELCQAL
jgi:hypothetical protein